MKKKQKQFNMRLSVVFVGIICVGFVLIANLFHIQVRTGKDLRAQADGQYVVATYNAFNRGDIIFESYQGDQITAAGQKKGYKISINPSRFSQNELENIYQKVNNIYPIDSQRFFSGTRKKGRTYFEIAHKVSKKDALEIKKELKKNISLHVEKWRIYPLQKSASHVLGFLGYDSNNIFGGRYGLERFYNSTLIREDVDLYTNFFARVFHGVQKFVDPQKKPEGNIIAGVDPQVQLFLERELSGIQEKWKSKSTGGIIMDPQTGQIIAMAHVPNFDNNAFEKESLSMFKNPLVSSVYEFGSVMKPLVVAIGLDQLLINAKTEYYDRGSTQVGKHTVSNFDKRGRGWVSIQEILNQSLNTGMVFITKKIPKQVFRDYFKNYGFGQKTGIDLPSDSVGLTTNLKSNRDIEFANISFGQGIAVSPLSFLRAAAVLANKGKTVTPHVVKKIEYTNGFSKKIEHDQDQVQVLTPETSHEISRMLVEVFDNYRKGELKFEHYTVAAKTGTAQIAHPKGGYYKDRNLHSFFSYFPAYEPKFIVLLYTVHPKKVKYSSETLIEPFRSLAKYLINYYNIPPDR